MDNLSIPYETKGKESVTTRTGFITGVVVMQIIVFLNASSGIAIDKAGDKQKPLLMATTIYFLMLSTNGLYLWRKQGSHLNIRWWKYPIFSCIDVTAVFCAMLSLKYTTVTSWALLQPTGLLLSIPVTMLLLQASYTWKHLGSVLLAMLGVSILLLSDALKKEENETKEAPNPILGDILAIAGNFLYSISSIIVETMTKNQVPQYEILAMLGCFGFLFSLFLSFVTEEISIFIFKDIDIVFYMSVAIFASFAFYMLAPIVLSLSGTATFQVCLLGTNVWSVLGKLIILDGFHVNPLPFILALVTVVLGVVFFTLSGDPYKQNKHNYVPVETEIEQQKINSAH